MQQTILKLKSKLRFKLNNFRLKRQNQKKQKLIVALRKFDKRFNCAMCSVKGGYRKCNHHAVIETALYYVNDLDIQDYEIEEIDDRYIIKDVLEYENSNWNYHRAQELVIYDLSYYDDMKEFQVSNETFSTLIPQKCKYFDIIVKLLSQKVNNFRFFYEYEAEIEEIYPDVSEVDEFVNNFMDKYQAMPDIDSFKADKQDFARDQLKSFIGKSTFEYDDIPYIKQQISTLTKKSLIDLNHQLDDYLSNPL